MRLASWLPIDHYSCQTTRVVDRQASPSPVQVGRRATYRVSAAWLAHSEAMEAACIEELNRARERRRRCSARPAGRADDAGRVQLTNSRARNIGRSGAPVDRMLGNVEHGRFERLRSGLTAVSALLTGAGGYFHGRGEAHKPGGWALAPRFAQQMASGGRNGCPWHCPRAAGTRPDRRGRD